MVTRILPVLGPDGVVRDITLEVEQAIKGGGGSVAGFELTVQQELSFLAFDGLGVALNYTDADSEVDSNGQPLQGTTSKTSGNAAVCYENVQFGVRLTYSTRGDWRNNGDTDYRLATSSLDGSAYYNLTDNIKLTLAAVNMLSDEFVRRLRGSEDVFDHGLSVSDIATNWTSYERNGREICFWLQLHILAGEICSAVSLPFPPGWIAPPFCRREGLFRCDDIVNQACLRKI